MGILLKSIFKGISTMSDAQQKLEEFAKVVKAKHVELLKKEIEVHEFIGSQHSIKATKAYQEELCGLAKDVNSFVIDMMSTKEGEEILTAEFEKLCKDGMALSVLARDISKALSEDLKEKQHNREIDHVKNTALIVAFGVAALTFSEKTFDPVHSYAAIEVATGSAFGATIGYRKQLRNAFSSLGAMLCKGTKKIINVFQQNCSQDADVKLSEALKPNGNGYSNDNAKHLVEWYGRAVIQRKITGFSPNL